MNKICATTLITITMCTQFLLHAYKYTFINRSDKKAEVLFKLAADITTNYKTETVLIDANSTNSITIPEWWRSGLCIDPYSIQIRFLPEGKLTKPRIKNKSGNIRSFESMRVPSFVCGDLTFDFTHDSSYNNSAINAWWPQ